MKITTPIPNISSFSGFLDLVLRVFGFFCFEEFFLFFDSFFEKSWAEACYPDPFGVDLYLRLPFFD
jgi:hypothetical protein